MSTRLAVLAGCGGVLGAALRAEFQEAGYAVAGLRRHAQGANEFACDFDDPAETEAVMSDLIDRLGPPDIVIFNGGYVCVSPFLELGASDFSASWAAGAGGAAACARASLPVMLARGSGCLILTGATASLRGSAQFAAMAAGKFALRGLAQSLAREFQPKGIHVAHIVLDGILRGSPAAERFGAQDAVTLDSRHVAATYRSIAEQPAQAWSHEIDLRPQGEKF